MGPIAHFTFSLILALLAAFAWTRVFHRRGVLPVTAAAFLVALLPGHFKEMVDLFQNPWSLPAPILLADTLSDLFWNGAGALSGALLFVAVSLATERIQKVCPPV